MLYIMGIWVFSGIILYLCVLVDYGIYIIFLFLLVGSAFLGYWNTEHFFELDIMPPSERARRA